VVLILWLAAASAQPAPSDTGDPSDEVPDPPSDGSAGDGDLLEQVPSAELVVYGERLVDKARREVVEKIEELGYDAEVKDQGDRVVYRHSAPWYGEVVLHDDGWVQVERQKIRVEGRAVPWAKKRNSVGAWLGCFVYPWACIRVYGATYSRRKWMGTQSRTVERLQPKVDELGDRIADLETARRVAALPDRLEELWDYGVPLERDVQPLATKAERRRAILEHWGSRTDTVWGRMIRESIENFVVAVVQDGPDAYTPEEIAAFNEGRAVPFALPSASTAEAVEADAP